MNKKEFITVLAITLIVVVVWIISDWVHTRTISAELPDVQKYLEPLEPNFDKETLDRISTLSTPAPAPSAGPLASPSPTTIPSPSPRAASASASPSSFGFPLASPATTNP